MTYSAFSLYKAVKDWYPNAGWRDCLERYVGHLGVALRQRELHQHAIDEMLSEAGLIVCAEGFGTWVVWLNTSDDGRQATLVGWAGNELDPDQNSLVELTAEVAL